MAGLQVLVKAQEDLFLSMHKLALYIAGSLQLLIILFASSCQSDDINLVYPIEPEILSVEVSPLQVQEFSDSLLFTISYRDGDGDIGWSEGDSLPLYIKDIRLSEADRFFVSFASVGIVVFS